jgi:hypothetical protein
MVNEDRIPPKIRELLKKKGWTWPPDEKLQKEMREALERTAGSIHTPPELLEEMAKDDHVLYNLLQKKKEKTAK